MITAHAECVVAECSRAFQEEAQSSHLHALCIVDASRKIIPAAPAQSSMPSAVAPGTACHAWHAHGRQLLALQQTSFWSLPAAGLPTRDGVAWVCCILEVPWKGLRVRQMRPRASVVLVVAGADESLLAAGRRAAERDAVALAPVHVLRRSPIAVVRRGSSPLLCAQQSACEAALSCLPDNGNCQYAALCI